MIDFHSHIDLYDNPADVVRTCAIRGLYVLSVTTTPRAWKITASLAGRRMQTALGLHPQLAHERKSELSLFDELLPQTEYVGEIGLDGAPGFRESWRDQCDIFEHILRSCTNAGGRVMSIHSRYAAGAVLDRIKLYPHAGTPVLHWFSGSDRELNRAINCGCWFSVGPAMLAGRKGRKLVSQMPRDRVLTETDGPFTQSGGRRLFPWDVDLAEKTLASIWQKNPDETQGILRENLLRLTGKRIASTINNQQDGSKY